jgi:hypothetical protein
VPYPDVWRVKRTTSSPRVQRQSCLSYFARQRQPLGPLEGFALSSIQDWMMRRARLHDVPLTLVMITW